MGSPTVGKRARYLAGKKELQKHSAVHWADWMVGYLAEKMGLWKRSAADWAERTADWTVG